MKKTSDKSQHQGSLTDQLHELLQLAKADGLYDAADWIERGLTRVTATRDTESTFTAVLELAAFFQDDYEKKLPVIAAFRRWRSGAITTDEFLARLAEDDLADVLRYETVPPMRGLAILNDHRQARRKP